MFDDGYFVYSSLPVWQYEPKSPIWNDLTAAAVTTFVSYQLAGLIFALSFLSKPRYSGSVSALFIVLLTRRPSILSLLSNLSRCDAFTRLYYRSHVKKNDNIVRDSRRIPRGVVVRLLFLMGVGPLSCVLVLILVTPRTKVLTFAEAGIKGLAFSITSNSTARRRLPRYNNAWDVPIRLLRGDEKVTELVHVRRFSSTEGSFRVNHGVIVAVMVTDRTNLVTMVFDETMGRAVTETMYLVRKNASHAIHVDDSNAEAYVKTGADKAARLCNNKPSIHRLQSQNVSVSASGTRVLAMRHIECEVAESPDELGDKLWLMVRDIIRNGSNIAPALGMKVENRSNVYDDDTAESKERDLINGLDLPFIQRRRRPVGLVMLLMIAAILCAVRTILESLSRNDTSAGIELVIRDRLGLKCCETMEGELQTEY